MLQVSLKNQSVYGTLLESAEAPTASFRYPLAVPSGDSNFEFKFLFGSGSFSCVSNFILWNPQKHQRPVPIIPWPSQVAIQTGSESSFWI